MGAIQKKRTLYAPEYPREVVHLVIDTVRIVVAVAMGIAVGEQLLGRWVHAERSRPDCWVDALLDVDERAELERLGRESHDLRLDNDLLGVAAAFFASTQNL